MKYAGTPSSVDALAAAFARLANGPSEVTEAHQGSKVGSPPVERHREAMPDDLLTRAETARRMRTSVATVKRRERAGPLPAVRHGRVVRYRVADIDALSIRSH